MAKKKLFISHISSETDIAQALKENLDRDFLGLMDIFVSSDRETILAGSKWLDEVERALKSADLLIVLCSERSLVRPWVNFEAGAAWLRGRPIIPVCHSGTKPDDLPMPLVLLQGVEVSQAAGIQKLYDRVAVTLKAKAPAADFYAIASDLKRLEQQYASLEQIENPNILCAASEQYAQPELGFQLDEAILRRSFPGRVTIERGLTRKRLLDLLSAQHFDIVHLVLAVDRETGDLVFSPTDFATYRPATPNPDIMSPSAFATLLLESQTRLVVLATCRALRLAVAVAHVANIAASDADITGQEAAEWEEVFYGQLVQGKSLFKAFDLAESQVPNLLFPVRYRDLVFKRGAAERP